MNSGLITEKVTEFILDKSAQSLLFFYREEIKIHNKTISKKLNNIGQIIKGVKTMATTKSYHQYLIESLKQPTEAAAYLWAILQEENPEPQLLKSALEDILEALGSTKLSSEEIERQKDQLKILLDQKGKIAIYSLSEWLQKLGLELNVKVTEETLMEQNNSGLNSKVMI